MASAILTPGSIDELREMVAREPRIRGLGTRHSFNAVADGPGVLVSTRGISPNILLDEDESTVTIGAGAPYAALAHPLEERGFALHNMGSLPHISVGGATATGTHGSGMRNGSLSTAVRRLEFVNADGSLRTVERGQPDFDGSVIHLGLLGVVTRVTLDIEPTFCMRQDIYTGLPWQSIVDGNLRDIMGCGYSVSIFTTFEERSSRLLVKTKIPQEIADHVVPTERFGAIRGDSHDETGLGLNNRTPNDGSIGPWHARLPHFRIDKIPSRGAEIQSEYFVAMDDGEAALRAVAELRPSFENHLIAAEIRTVKGDNLWLSETQGRDCLCIHFTWERHPDAVRALLPHLERALESFKPRPHWAKVSAFTHRQLAAAYPRLRDLGDLASACDPEGKFTSALITGSF